MLFFLGACDQTSSPSEIIGKFMKNVDKRSQFLPVTDSSELDPKNSLYLLSNVTIVSEGESQNDVTSYFVASFCLHGCFQIKFRYLGGFLEDNNETSEYSNIKYKYLNN